MPIVMFLLEYWKYFAAVALILCIFGYWKSLTMKVDRQAKEIIQLKVDDKVSEFNTATCLAANTEFKKLIDKMNAENQTLMDLNKKSKDANVQLADMIKKKNSEIAAKETALANVPWGKLDCPEQVNACYEILRGQP